MSTNTTTTTAYATLQKTDQGYLWIVPHCPLCGAKHIHGAGILGGDPYKLLGHRIAHCDAGGYMLAARQVLP